MVEQDPKYMMSQTSDKIKSVSSNGSMKILFARSSDLLYLV